MITISPVVSSKGYATRIACICTFIFRFWSQIGSRWSLPVTIMTVVKSREAIRVFASYNRFVLNNFNILHYADLENFTLKIKVQWILPISLKYLRTSSLLDWRVRGLPFTEPKKENIFMNHHWYWYHKWWKLSAKILDRWLIHTVAFHCNNSNYWF